MIGTSKYLASAPQEGNTSSTKDIHEGAVQRNNNKNDNESTDSSKSDSESQTGSSVMSKIDSNSTSIKDAYYNAKLNTVADAGSNGQKEMNSSATMTSGKKISQDKIPSAAEFIPKPKYKEIGQIEKPTIVKLTNDVVIPDALKSKFGLGSVEAGSDAEAESASESEAVAGSLADTLASIGQNESQIQPPSKYKYNQEINNGAAPKHTLDIAGKVNSLKNQTSSSMYPQRVSPDIDIPINWRKKGRKPINGQNSEKWPNIFVTDKMNDSSSSSSESGSMSMSQVGSFAETESGTGYRPSPIPLQEGTDPYYYTTGNGIKKKENEKLSTFMKPSVEIGLLPLPPDTMNQRIFQTVSDVVSDSSGISCPDGQDCVETPSRGEKVSLSSNTPKTEATSNQTSGATLQTNNEQLRRNDDKNFNATVWFQNKKFSIVGTASEVDVNISEEKKGAENTQIPENPPQLDYPKVPKKNHNIGFHVMLPARVTKLSPNKDTETATKSSLNSKVLQLITDPSRTRKTNVPPQPHVSDILSSAIREPDTVEMLAVGKDGEAGDIGAVKPVSRGM